MHLTGEFIRGAILLVLFGGIVLWLVVYTIRNAEDPARMVFKWVLTALIITFMVKVVAPLVGRGGYEGAFAGIPLAAVSGLALAIIWRHHLAELVARPIASLYDGGSTPPDPHPAYSVAQARQKQGRYVEAVLEIRQQLEKFPTDLEGHMLMAEIQARDLKDLPAAELTIEQLCSQPGHAPANLAYALYSLADWHLQFGADREAARRAFQKIIDLLPETEFALGAAQRIAHLRGPEEEKIFTVREGPKYAGLVKNPTDASPPEKSPDLIAQELVAHLEAHPQDTEARERLAAIYVDHYARLDLAADQLEQIIQQPNQPARLVVRWLNLLADLQIRAGADFDTVRSTLERIVERGPNLAAAENARTRISHLKLELKAKQAQAPIKLGTYEQNIGLKRAKGS